MWYLFISISYSVHEENEYVRRLYRNDAANKKQFYCKTFIYSYDNLNRCPTSLSKEENIFDVLLLNEMLLLKRNVNKCFS